MNGTSLDRGSNSKRQAAYNEYSVLEGHILDCQGLKEDGQLGILRIDTLERDQISEARPPSHLINVVTDLRVGSPDGWFVQRIELVSPGHGLVGRHGDRFQIDVGARSQANGTTHWARS